MPSPTADASETRVWPCTIEGCDRVAAVSLTTDGVTWDDLCDPCLKSFTKGYKNTDGAVASTRPPFPDDEAAMIW